MNEMTITREVREARLEDIPGIDAALAQQAARLVARVRKQDLAKMPGVAATLDWAAALVGLGVSRVDDDRAAVHDILCCVLKAREDQSRITRAVSDRLVGEAT